MFRLRTGMLVVVLLVAACAPGVVGSASAQEVTLDVTVVTETGGTVNDAVLTATWDGGSETTETSATGRALIDVPRGAAVEITVEHGRYMRNAPFEVADATTSEIEIPVALKGDAVVSVIEGDDPIRGATVRFQDGGVTAASVRTMANGVAEVGPIEQGNYALIVGRSGYYEHTSNVDVGEGTELQVTLQRGTVDLTVRVEDDHFDSPRAVANATVSIEPIGSSLVTLDDGAATAGVPVNRNYEVTVSKEDYESHTQEVRVSESPTELSATINRSPDLVVEAANSRIVVGETTRVTVSDEYGDPIAGATVTRDGDAVGETDANGQFDVPIETEGEVTIEVSDGGLSDDVTVEGVRPGQADEPTETPAETETEAETDGGLGHGFGPVVGLVAVAIGAGWLARRR